MENIIKIEELRVGNIISQQITIDDWRDIYVNALTLIQCEINPDIFEPIPLTEEWLLRFGFEGSEIFKNSYILNSVEIYIQDGLYWYDFGNDRVEVKTIHQLQNLYFALTGTELKINTL